MKVGCISLKVPNMDDPEAEGRKMRKLSSIRDRIVRTFSLASVKIFSRFKGEDYLCPKCKYVLSKEEVKISGHDFEHSSRHVHCPRCGKAIASFFDRRSMKDVVEGAGLTLAGGSLTYLLFPVLNIYALHLGFFASFFGTLKIILGSEKR